MEDTVNKAQKFLLDNNCGDLILNDVRAKNAEDRIYASDIMMKFLESERGQNVDTSEKQCTIPVVVVRSAILDVKKAQEQLSIACKKYIESKPHQDMIKALKRVGAF